MSDDEASLRNAALRAILAATCHASNGCTYGGQPGDDTSCAVCSAALTHDQLTLTMQFIHDRPGVSGALYAHLPYLVAWDQERHQFEAT